MKGKHILYIQRKKERCDHCVPHPVMERARLQKVHAVGVSVFQQRFSDRNLYHLTQIILWQMLYTIYIRQKGVLGFI